jgi:hypothetical protein
MVTFRDTLDRRKGRHSTQQRCHDDTYRVIRYAQKTVHSMGQLCQNDHGIDTRRILRHAVNPRYL